MLRRILPLAGICLLLPAFAGAQSPPPPQDDMEPGWHFVRLGETLEALAARSSAPLSSGSASPSSTPT